MGGATIDLLLVGVSHRTAPVARARAAGRRARRGPRGAGRADRAAGPCARRRCSPPATASSFTSRPRTRIARPPGWPRCWRGARASPWAIWPSTSTSTGTPRRSATCSGSPPASIRWWWASRRSSARPSRRTTPPSSTAPRARCCAPASRRARSASRGGCGARRRSRRNPVSVSSVAVDFARQVVGDFARRHVLIVGAGKMSELAARTLRTHGATLTVINRTRARADELATALRRRRRRLERPARARSSRPTSSSRRRARSGRC